MYNKEYQNNELAKDYENQINALMTTYFNHDPLLRIVSVIKENEGATTEEDLFDFLWDELPTKIQAETKGQTEEERDQFIRSVIINYLDTNVMDELTTGKTEIIDALVEFNTKRADLLTAQYNLKASQGYLVGLYKANGEVDEVTIETDSNYDLGSEGEIINKHLLGMSYIKQEDVSDLNKIAQRAISIGSSLVLAGLQISLVEAVKGTEAKTVFFQKLNECIRDAEVFQPYVDNSLILLTSSATSDAINRLKEEPAWTEEQKGDLKLLNEKIHDLCSNYNLEGKTSEELEALSLVKGIATLASLAVPGGALAAMAITGIIEAFDLIAGNSISAARGESEWNRFT